jgi:hypothetical protein
VIVDINDSAGEGGGSQPGSVLGKDSAGTSVAFTGRCPLRGPAGLPSSSGPHGLDGALCYHNFGLDVFPKCG